SHDLRTPLAAISANAASLRDELKSQANLRQQAMLESLVNESHQLVRLVENLLDMARLESGSIEFDRQWDRFEELVRSALARTRRGLQSHHIVVHIPESFPLIYVDGFLLEQSLVNLLENASRYTPQGCTIEISARTSGNRAEISVADNGPGLPPGSETRVFEKFFRAQATPSDGRRGAGLGLAIC